ncbi:MAG: asparaginyl-tRNA synthetase [Candidatus Omnitrophota bacterium]|jgi:asparaginyl-tRNA synthetase
MSTNVSIQDLGQHVGQEVTLRGWLDGKRSSGKLVFLLVRDGTGICQCTVEAQHEDAFARAGEIGHESSLTVTGTVQADERSPGGFELSAHAITVIQNVEEFPIARKQHGIDFLMNHRHLWLRSHRQTAILRVRHTIIKAARDFFDSNGYTLIDTPIFQPGAAEGAGTLFGVDYFDDEKAYLAQTGQLYLETAAMALGKVYCFGPTFRAEKSKTRRHLTEFWMIEPEVAFYELPDIERLAEDFITHLVKAVLADNREDLEALGRDISALEKIETPFPRMTYSEAAEYLRSDALHAKLEKEMAADQEELTAWGVELVQLEAQQEQVTKAWKKEKIGQEIQALKEQIKEREVDLQNRPLHLEDARTFEWGKDFGGDEETILSKQFDRPLIVTEYPAGVKAFYMKRSPDNDQVVLNLDVLAPEGYGEIVGGSQREDELDNLLERMAAEGMDTGPYEWYLDLRRFGTVPHGGFGLGIERTVSWICGLKHIRESIPFPRLLGRLYP